MKDKMIIFCIGLLVGAVISTGSFFIYTTTLKNCNCRNNRIQMNGGNPPSMNNNGPEQNQNNNNNTQQPPEKPSEENNNN